MNGKDGKWRTRRKALLLLEAIAEALVFLVGPWNGDFVSNLEPVFDVMLNSKQNDVEYTEQGDVFATSIEVRRPEG